MKMVASFLIPLWALVQLSISVLSQPLPIFLLVGLVPCTLTIDIQMIVRICGSIEWLYKRHLDFVRAGSLYDLPTEGSGKGG